MLVKMLAFISYSEADLQEKIAAESDHHNVTIHDARKNNPGTFYETGFTLITLEEELEDIDWRSKHLFMDTDIFTAYAGSCLLLTNKVWLTDRKKCSI